MERRLVTVMFADLVGFTSLAEVRDPEEVRELLTQYFDVTRDIVARHGGSIEKFIGDAVMAAWGIPTAHEDDAERAVRAALEMTEAVRKIGVSDLDLDVRAGVLTGEAAISVGATEQGMVAGDLVNTASRLQSAAPPGTVLVGEATRRATELAITYEPMGDLKPKGKTVSVPVFRALRVIGRRGGFGRPDVLEPPFVGREAELRLVKDLFHSTGAERRPRLVSILGQAGIGKSRLAWELLKYVDGVAEVAYWHHGRSPAYGDGLAFWALGEMVRGRAGIAEGDDAETSRASLHHTVEEFVTDPGERTWIGSRLEELLGLAIDGTPASGSSDTIFAAWRTFFERISERGTVVMVFEDLHWADQGTLDFIEHVLDWSRAHPIYILALGRPELLDRRGDWGLTRRNATSLTLEPLSRTGMRSMLDGLVPGLPEDHAEAIVNRAEGVPLYAVETVRMLINDGTLEPADGAYRVVGELRSVAVPATLHALVAARLDALEPRDRRLLQVASVLGKTFTVEALAALSGLGADGIEPVLRGLVRRQLLVIDADPRSPERGQYGFVQSVLREVAYASLARRERRELHLAAARYFETVDDEEIAGILAAHFVEAYRAQPQGDAAASVAAQARVALRAAAERATRLGANAQALGYVLQALELTDEPDERADLLDAAGMAAVHTGQRRAAGEYLRAAVDLRRASVDRTRLLRSTALLGRAAVFEGELERARTILEEAANAFADLAETASYVELVSELTRAYMRSGLNSDAVRWADRVLPTAERLDLRGEVLEILINRGTSLSSLGRLQEAAATLLGAIRLAELYQMPAAEVRAIVNTSFVAEYDEPRMAQSRHGLELVRRYGLRAFLPFLVSNAARGALNRGDWAWGLATIDEEAAGALSDEERANIVSMGIELRILRGEAGQDEVRALEELWLPSDDPQIVSAAVSVSGLLALAEGRLEDAFDRCMEAFKIHAPYGVDVLPMAADAALWIRDLDRASRVRARLATLTGRIVANHLRVLDAGIAALEGRTNEAIVGFREAMRMWQQVGYRFRVVMTGISMVSTLGPDHPEAKDAASVARQSLTELEATPLIRRLEAACADFTSAPAHAPTPAAREPLSGED